MNFAFTGSYFAKQHTSQGLLTAVTFLIKLWFGPMMAAFFLNKHSGLWHAITSVSEKNGSDSSLTAVSGFRKSIWHWVLV